jgi:hypothetical protein
VLQATIGEYLAFDPFAFEEDGLSPSEVDVGRSEIGQTLLVSRMVVGRHEGRNPVQRCAVKMPGGLDFKIQTDNCVGIKFLRFADQRP